MSDPKSREDREYDEEAYIQEEKEEGEEGGDEGYPSESEYIDYITGY